MNRGTKILMAILIVVTAGLAGTSGFFYAKSNSLQDKLNTDQKSTDSSATTATDSNKDMAVKAPKPATTTPVATSSADSRPSSPSDTVVVASGETLFQIGQKAGVSYLLIAEANGIDANNIKVGQTLIIPKNNQIGYTINKDKAASLQQDVDNGKYAFRLIPLDTVKADTPPAYGLVSTDSYKSGKTDASAGSATVSATKGDKTYTITLVQPATKGEKGIWAIESIKPQTK